MKTIMRSQIRKVAEKREQYNAILMRARALRNSRHLKDGIQDSFCASSTCIFIFWFSFARDLGIESATKCICIRNDRLIESAFCETAKKNCILLEPWNFTVVILLFETHIFNKRAGRKRERESTLNRVNSWDLRQRCRICRGWFRDSARLLRAIFKDALNRN